MVLLRRFFDMWGNFIHFFTMPCFSLERQHTLHSCQLLVRAGFISKSVTSQRLPKISRRPFLPLLMPLPIWGLSNTLFPRGSPSLLEALTHLLPYLWSFWASLSWGTDFIPVDNSHAPAGEPSFIYLKEWVPCAKPGKGKVVVMSPPTQRLPEGLKHELEIIQIGLTFSLWASFNFLSCSGV